MSKFFKGLALSSSLIAGYLFFYQSQTGRRLKDKAKMQLDQGLEDLKEAQASSTDLIKSLKHLSQEIPLAQKNLSDLSKRLAIFRYDSQIRQNHIQKALQDLQKDLGRVDQEIYYK